MINRRKPIMQLTEEELVKDAQKFRYSNPMRAKEDKNELLRRFKTFLAYRASAYRQAQLPLSAIKAEAYGLLFRLVDSFKPKHGVKFKTYVESSMIKLSRFVNQNKDIARIPEQRFLKINVFESKKNYLTNLKGREPSTTELGDHLGWSTDEVTRMQAALGRRPLAQEETMGRKFAPMLLYGDKWKETKSFVYTSDLSPTEQLVYDYSEGAHGKPVMRAKDIARRLHISLDKVYQLRRRIDDLIAKNMR